MGVFMFVLFTSLVIIVGVLTIYFTSPKPSIFNFKVDFEFQTLFFSIRGGIVTLLFSYVTTVK
jgi:hypothetical protein